MIAALAVATVGCGPAPDPRPAASPVPARGVGAVEVTTLERRPSTLRDAVGGRAALVTLWATWCEACLKEIDALNRLDDGARKRGGVVLGVNEGEPVELVSEFARERGIRYGLVLDPELRVADALGRRRLPATLVLDRSGRVIHTGGVLDEAALAAFREALGAP